MFLIIFGFGSCKTLHLSHATQRHHVSGLPNVKNNTSYSFTVEATKPFTLLKMVLVSNNRQTPITSISFTNNQTMVGHTFQLPPNKPFQAGAYSFGFTQLQADKKNTQQQSIQLTYMLNKSVVVSTLEVRQGSTQIGK